MELSALLPTPVSGSVGDEQRLQEARTSADADFDSFLRLLTAQLENQDPMEPLDSTQFVAQLASFSTVEQLISANERLDSIAVQATAGDIASFASWIGRDIASTDGKFRATGSEHAFMVPQVAGAERIEAIVRNPAGVAIRTMTVAADETGRAIWDGEDASGRSVTGSGMSIELNYIQGGTIVDTRQAEVLRHVTGIRGTQDGPVLELADGESLSPSAVSRLQSSPGS